MQRGPARSGEGSSQMLQLGYRRLAKTLSRRDGGRLQPTVGLRETPKRDKNPTTGLVG